MTKSILGYKNLQVLISLCNIIYDIYCHIPRNIYVLDMMTASALLIKFVFVQKQGRIPVKWTAIEAMTGAMKYSTKSDVYVELT